MPINFEPVVPHVILLLMEKDGTRYIAAIEERSPSGVHAHWSDRLRERHIEMEMQRKSGLNPESLIMRSFYLGTCVGGDYESSRHFMAYEVSDSEVDWRRMRFLKGTFVPKRNDPYREVQDPEIRELLGYTSSSGYVMAAIGLLRAQLERELVERALERIRGSISLPGSEPEEQEEP